MRKGVNDLGKTVRFYLNYSGQEQADIPVCEGGRNLCCSVSCTCPEVCYAIVDAAVYYGLAAGIVEEAMFRGVIMTVLVRRWNGYVGFILSAAGMHKGKLIKCN